MTHPESGTTTGQDARRAEALLSLAHARYDWFCGQTDLSMPPWRDLSEAQQLTWCSELEHLVPVVLAGGDERRHRALLLVGAQDITDGQGDDCCLASCGPWDCTRKPHTDAPHAAGAGGVIVAAWELA